MKIDNIQRNRLIRKNFNWAIQKYFQMYQFDLSCIKLQISKIPCFNDGKLNLEMNPDEFGGCWTNQGFIRINPDIEGVMAFYGVDSSIDEFNKKIIAHELAHEIYKNVASKQFKEKILNDALSNNFHTIYLDYVSQNKKAEETFCEYLANTLLEK